MVCVYQLFKRIMKYLEKYDCYDIMWGDISYNYINLSSHGNKYHSNDPPSPLPPLSCRSNLLLSMVRRVCEEFVLISFNLSPLWDRNHSNDTSSETNVLLTLVRYPGGKRDKGQYCPLAGRSNNATLFTHTYLYLTSITIIGHQSHHHNFIAALIKTTVHA